jgi:DNA polymerase-3 subunit delta
VTVSEFLEQSGSEPPANVYLFCPAKVSGMKGSSFEPFLAEQAVERLVNSLVDPTMKDLAYATFYADEVREQEVVMEAQTLPFLVERRVVLVRGAERYQTETAGKALLAYLENPSESTVLILLASTIDRRTKFFKQCGKVGVVVECPELNEREAAHWVRQEAVARGKSVDSAAVTALVERSGTHLSDLNNALNVLIGYVGERGAITGADVMAACADVAEEEVWALTDAIASSETGAALRSLRRLIDFGKQPDELMGIINWLLTSAYAVASAGGGKPKISPFVARKVTPLADKLGIEKLRAAFALCTDTHFMIRSTGIDSALSLELLVVKLAAPQPKRRSAVS